MKHRTADITAFNPLRKPWPWKHGTRRTGGWRRWRGAVTVVVWGLLVLANTGSAGATDGPSALEPRLFPLPEELHSNVEFWTTVYSGYDSHHRLLHDERHLQVIYEVLDFTTIDESSSSESRKRQAKRQKLKEAEAKYRTILNNLAAGKVSSQYPDDQERVAALFESVSGDRSKYSRAISRMRSQTCLKDRFAEGIERSGLYMAEIEEIFAERGLPSELSRLPFVESLFQIRAHSSASAAGIWQFVRGTARLYLKMDLEYDERYDPLRASAAAADHLQDNYESLKTWPLALTAYNHGANGMRRAVRLLGTRDLGEISRRYRSRTFGFASRNFYSEFLAAATVYERRDHYFPDVEPLPAVEFEVFKAREFVPVAELSRRASVPLDEIREINPGLAREIWSDNLYLPGSYELRVPRGRGEAFKAAYAGLPADLRSGHQVGLHYRVRRGDTLGKIAARYGVSVGALQRANRLSNPNRIRLGQQLLIPPGKSTRRRTRTTSPAIAAAGGGSSRPDTHVVRKGENLSLIARRYGVSVRSLEATNNLANAHRIHVGQRLRIPDADHRTHVVRRGETLSRIARTYGSTVQAIKSANGLRGDVIRPSQLLVIP